jgi:hypothetical protein
MNVESMQPTIEDLEEFLEGNADSLEPEEVESLLAEISALRKSLA